jgi:FixJ family two-component response regulator
MTRVAAGLLNKQVAGELATTERTIKFHRAHIMQKMGATSLADLVRMAEKLGVSSQG